MSDSGSGNDDFEDAFGDFGDAFGGGGFDPQAMMASFMSLFGQGGGGLGQAVQIATSIATGGQTEPNVDPVDRIALEQLARVAELQIEQRTGLRVTSGQPLSIAAVTKSEWTRRSMAAFAPILEVLATAMSQPPATEADAAPELAIFEQLLGSMRPMMVNVTSGSMVGHLGVRALGTYDLPLPRPDADELLVVVPNLDALTDEWSLERDDLRMWIVLSEVTHHALLSIEHVAARMTDLLHRYTSAFETESIDLDQFSDFEPTQDLADLQQQIQSMVGDPTALLGSMRSDRQREILPELSAIVAPIVGYVDYMMDDIGGTLISSYSQLTEALRRRRVTASESDRFVERLLGLELDQALFDRGRAFIDGIVSRSGEDALAMLWSSEESLPTPNEIDAPGLWLARNGLDAAPGADEGAAAVGGVEIDGAADDLSIEDFLD